MSRDCPTDILPHPFHIQEGTMRAFFSGLCGYAFAGVLVCVSVSNVTGKEALSQHFKSLGDHSKPVWSVAFSSDGQTLASAGTDSSVKLWDVTTGVLIDMFEHEDVVRSVAFSPDRRTLAAAAGRSVLLWDVQTLQAAGNLTPHRHNVSSVAFSSDGSTLAACSFGEVRLWRMATQEHVGTLPHDHWVEDAAFSPDGTTVVTASWGGNSSTDAAAARIWDVADRRIIDVFEGHQGRVNSVAFSPRGDQFVSGSDDGAVMVWDVSTGENATILEGHGAIVTTVALSPDGTIIASGSESNAVGSSANAAKVWDVASGNNTGTLRVPFSGGNFDFQAVYQVAFSPNGKTVALATGLWGMNRNDDNGAVVLWDVSQYTSTVPPSSGSNSDAVLSLDLIPDGGAGNQVNDGVTSGTVAGKDTKIAVEVFASGVKTSPAGVLVKFDFDSSVLAFVKAESGAFGFNIPQATGTYFAATENVLLPASGFLARGEFKTLVEVTNRPFSIGIDVVTLAESQTVSDDIRTTKVISFNSTPPPATFSVSLDGNTAAGDQGVTTLDVATGSVVPIQLFGNDIRGVNGVSARFEFDVAQVGYDGFDPGNLLPNAQLLAVPSANPTAIDISVVSFGGQATVESGLLGSVRFRTTDTFSGTTLRLVSAELGRGDQREKLALSDTGVTLRLAKLTPDFNGDGKVDFGRLCGIWNALRRKSWRRQIRRKVRSG